jgi:hypothetical protein
VIEFMNANSGQPATKKPRKKAAKPANKNAAA